MARPLSQQVVVITGASQGIGRETALRIARRGAAVVAAARNEEAPTSLTAEITDEGGRAEAVPTDVADHDHVDRLAARSIERFGRIDTWVNNAAVSVYASVEQLEPDEMERIVRVNLLGQMFGAREAIPHLRAAGGGTIINVGSALSERAIPLQSAYVATKHAVQGFSEALRLEMAHEASGIEVVRPVSKCWRRPRPCLPAGRSAAASECRQPTTPSTSAATRVCRPSACSPTRG
jgi:NAD(P)-dependent dehydrogenase (short-subunit alcohol dehydrogenase family)